MKLTKIAFVTAVTMSVAFVAAQAAPVGRQQAKTQTRAGMAARYQQGARVLGGLKLTDDQKAQVKQIMESQKGELAALKQDQTLTKEQKIARMEELKQSVQAQIRAILTPEQQQKFDKISANPQRNRQEMRSQVGDRLQKAGAALNLTEAQKAQIKQIMESHRGELAALKADQSLTREQKVAKLKELKQAVQAQIRAILTPEQQQKFDKISANPQRNRQGMRRQVGDRLEKAAAALNLTPEQKAQIKQIMESQNGELAALKADQSLTREQKVAKLKELKQSVQAQIRAILTPEQQQKFDRMASRAGRQLGERMKVGRRPGAQTTPRATRAK